MKYSRKDQDEINHGKRGNKTRKIKCIDCSENYEAEKNDKEKLNCCFCGFSAHGCPIFEQQEISKGYVWFCEECRNIPKRFNLTYMMEERIDLINMIEEMKKKDKISKDKKRKRSDSEIEDKNKESNEYKIKSQEKNRNEAKETKSKSELSESKIIQLERLGIAIMEVDLESAKGNNWMHDALIKMYMIYLQEEFKNDELLFMDPSVVQMLRNVNAKVMEEQLNAMQLWYKKHIYIPLSDNNTNLEKEGGSHWSLLVYNLDEETWYHMDSCKGYNTKHARRLAERINRYINGSTPIEFKEPKCTQQDNNNDCGAYMMLFTKKCTELAENGEQIESFIINKNKVREQRECIENIIMVERQIKKNGYGTKSQKKEDEEKKGRKKINDMREFITSVQESKDISENMKSEIITQMRTPKVTIKEDYNKDHNKENEPGRQMMKEYICRNWARNECMDKHDCIYGHPVICEDQIRKGYCTNRNKCRFYHPKICWDNRNMEKCRRGIGCSYRHIHDEKTIENEYRKRNWNNTKNYENHNSHRNENGTRKWNNTGDYERRHSHSHGRTPRSEMNNRENVFLWERLETVENHMRQMNERQENHMIQMDKRLENHLMRMDKRMTGWHRR